MPKTGPGAWWNMNVISEDFGFIDTFYIEIPKDLKDKKPLGDSYEAYKKVDRQPCLIDLGYENNLTWPLRFNVDKCEITFRNGHNVEIKKPRKPSHGITLRGISKKRKMPPINRGIQIQ